MSQRSARDTEPASAPPTGAWPDAMRHPTAQQDERIGKDRTEPPGAWPNLQPDVWPWARAFCLIYGAVAFVMTTVAIWLTV